MKKYLCLIISLLNAVATAIYIALIDKDIVLSTMIFTVMWIMKAQNGLYVLPAIFVVMAVVFLIIGKGYDKKY